MAHYKEYSNMLYQSVRHIFRNFVKEDVETVLENSIPSKKISVSVDMIGSLKAELIFHYPHETIKNIMNQMTAGNDKTSTKRKTVSILEDVACEISNMMSGTFINHLQFIGHDLDVTPPEIQEGDEDYVRSLYESVSLSFSSEVGFFDVDFYYREMEDE